MPILSAVFAFIRKPLGIAVIAIAVIAVGTVALSRSNGSPAVAVVERTDVLAHVAVSGTTKAATSLNLGFARAGTIGRVYAAVGTRVVPGQTIAELVRTDLAASLAEAEAAVAVASAKLDELKRGTRPEELAITQEKRDGAARTFEDVIRSGYASADNAIRADADQLFSNPGSYASVISIAQPGQLASNLETGRILLEQQLAKTKGILTTLNDTDLAAPAAAVRELLTATTGFLDQLVLLLSGSLGGTSLSQTTLDGYRADISSARTAVNKYQESLTDAGGTYAVATHELTLALAGTSAEELAAQRATLAQAQAKADGVRAEIGKAVIRSPITGIIARQDAKVGEFAAANAALTTLQADDVFEVEADVPESDIARITVGNEAQATVDAFGDETALAARVVSIEPAERLIDGVTTYRVLFRFDRPDARIRSGMTVNLAVATDSRTGVLAIPSRFTVSRDGKKFVLVLDGDGSARETEVTTGLRGSDGMVEIISGLSEGDRVTRASEQ